MTALSAQISVPLSPTTAYSGDALSQSRKRFDMQALPFDDTDLTTPVSAPPSSWIDTSPRVPIVSTQQQQFNDEDIYRLVGAASPPNPNEELIPRYSHLPQFSQRQQQQQQQHPQHPHLSHQSTATSTSALPHLQRPPAIPQQLSRHALSNSPPRPSRLPPPAHPMPQQQQPQQQQQQQQHARKLTRSAVEEARIRAQREAESFASMRRETPKRDVITTASDKDTPDAGRAKKRIRTEPIDPKRTPVVGIDESDMEKQQRYRRRLDMNRESAAVSRVRRKAYVSELEKRLATVEAEKLQLEGKLEMLMQQNEGYKKQLENLFLMVASGRRPPYPGPVPHAGNSPHASSAQQSQNPPPQTQGPPS